MESITHYGKIEINPKAPVAQWIERWPPEPEAQVRFLPGVFTEHRFDPSVKSGMVDTPFSSTIIWLPRTT